MQYDVTVIGSGPGGYVAAIRCAQLGMKVALIEKYSTLGGTCLNVGCIPSKALLDSTEHYYNATHHFDAHGIKIEGIKLDLPRMIERKNEVVKQTCDGVVYLMKKNKIDVYHGVGSFIDKNTVEVTKEDGSKQQLTSQKVIIATGSKPASIPTVPIDKKRIITSTEALNITELPQKMIVIGAGVIGLEMGSVFARLGTEVHIVEYMDRAIPTMDSTMSKEIEKVLKKLGIQFYFKHKVLEAKATDKQATVKVETPKGDIFDLKADYCLVAIGRRPYTEGLGLEKVGVKTDERGRVLVNEKLQTNIENIYAIGDVVRGPMLAHKASEEGVFVAEVIAGQKPHLNYRLIPGVVYTWPEVASVGYTEEELQEQSIPYKKGQFPFRALGRARASMDLDGLVKVLAHKETDEILGVHIIGARAADMIAEAVVAMEFRASAEDLARISHAHPTYMEAVKEACLAATENRPLHI
jgi:dihydrolipoamide dehydrogenase